MTLDEIYELFIWDASYTNEEYEARTEIGINEAKKYKYIYPFIQPVVPGYSKPVWEPCAKVVVSKSDEELEPYLYLLFEWLEDMNWPGAYTIFDRLCKMPFPMLEGMYNYFRQQAEKNHDSTWLMVLDDLKKQIESNKK